MKKKKKKGPNARQRKNAILANMSAAGIPIPKGNRKSYGAAEETPEYVLKGEVP